MERWRLGIASAVAIAGAVVVNHFAIKAHEAELKTSMAELKIRTAEQLTTQAEVEQGHQALLHGELDEAQRHLSEAYRRGDHSPAVAFMLARALQPLLAEKARFAASSGHLWSAAFSPDGRQLVTTDDACARIWDARTHQLMFTLPHGDAVYDARYSSDGARLVTASGDGAVRIWDASTGKLLYTLKRQRADGKPVRYFVAALSPDNRLVAAIDDGGAVVVAEALGMPVAVLDVPQGIVRTAHFDPTSHFVAGASGDGIARVWDATSPYRKWSSPPIADDCGLTGSIEPDGRFLAIGCRDHGTRVWDTARDQLVAELPSVTPVAGDFASAFPAVNASGDRAAIARGNTVEVYGLPGPRLLRTIQHGAPVNAVAFGPSGHDLVSGAIDGSLLVTRDTLRRPRCVRPVAESTPRCSCRMAAW